MAPGDRRTLETWTLTRGGTIARVFAGQVWIANNLGNLDHFDPAGTAGPATPILDGLGTGLPALAFDGTSIWHGGASSPNLARYPVGSPSATIQSLGANILGMAFDGTNMWVLLSDKRLLKMDTTGAVVETVTLPNTATDCRMIFDGTNIWIPPKPSRTFNSLIPRPSTGGT